MDSLNQSSGKGTQEEDIKAAYSRVIDAIQYVAAYDEVGSDLQKITSATLVKIKKFIVLDICAIYLINDLDHGFVIKVLEPESGRADIEEYVNTSIDNGTFAWALNQNRAIVLHGDKIVASKVLHVIAIRERVVGMFIGLYNEEESGMDEVSLALLSIVLSNCASQCESSRLQLELQNNNAELEKRVERRTQELEIAKQRAERASKVKSNFLAMMSHEIRTPMNGVLGMAQLLSLSVLDEKQQEQVCTILDSGKLLQAIIDDILDFSKIEAGKLTIKSEPFELSKQVASTIELFAARAAEKKIDLRSEVSPACHEYFVGDANRIGQVLNNLVSNALKFTIDGWVRIKVDVVSERDDKVRIVMRVQDTGIGIDENVQKKLFNEFTQADHYITRRFGGTGLGLAICRRLVAMMGGEIGIESKFGCGSDFWFEIELVKASESQVGENLSLAKSDSREKNKLNGKILIVEDNLVNQMVVLGMLESFGVETEIANNGAEAVEKYDCQDFDLVLMDCQMPVMNGYTATQKIRTLEEQNNGYTPIVALSAEVGDVFIDECMAAGMDEIMSKPVTLEKLYNTLKRYLNTENNVKHA